MKQRILFCGEVPFPRGAAGSNLTLCFAKLFEDIGYDVVYIGLDSKAEDKLDKESGLYIYEGIKYVTVKSEGKVISKLNSKLLSGSHTVEKLKILGANKDDIIVIYATNGIYIKAISDFAKASGIKICSICVEWHQPFQYAMGKYDIKYISNKAGFEKYLPRTKNVIVISKLLENIFNAKKCRTTVVPVILDCKSNKDMICDRENAQGRIRNFIYAGEPFGKDDINTMLKGISLLKKEEQCRMKFYWVGMKIENAKAGLGEDAHLLDDLSDCVEVLDRMDYDELMEFYKKMDFLYLSRVNNKVSAAGFPSKVPEAMLRGMIPVISKMGDCPIYLKDGEDVIFCNDNTPESCKEGLLRAINMPEEELSEMRSRTLKSAVNIFDYHNWAEPVKDFMMNLI